jgi:membrane-associated phospholipid phosphatase
LCAYKGIRLDRKIAARLLLPVLLGVFSLAPCAGAEDNIFNSTTAIKDGFVRLGNEAVDVAATPVDVKGHGLIGTLATAGAVGLTYVFDDDIRDKLQGTKSGALETATDVGAIIGNPFVHLGVAGVVYGGGVLADSPKWRETGEMLGEAALLADAATFVLKQAIGRSRPSETGEKGSFRPFQFKSGYDSMPSMHTASSFAMASVMASTSENHAVKALYYSVAAFVGFSRMYQDKHWAADVVLGAAIGELCGRVVTRHHASHRKIALVPMISADSASLALVGSWQ